MAQKRITISSTDKFEKKVLKFIHSQKLKGVKINRSSLDVESIKLFIDLERLNIIAKAKSSGMKQYEFILKAVQNYKGM